MHRSTWFDLDTIQFRKCAPTETLRDTLRLLLALRRGIFIRAAKHCTHDITVGALLLPFLFHPGRRRRRGGGTTTIIILAAAGLIILAAAGLIILAAAGSFRQFFTIGLNDTGSCYAG